MSLCQKDKNKDRSISQAKKIVKVTLTKDHEKNKNIPSMNNLSRASLLRKQC